MGLIKISSELKLAEKFETSKTFATHFVFAVLINISLVIQGIMGYFLKRSQENKTERPFLKASHSIFGNIMIFIIKCEAFMGLLLNLWLYDFEHLL